LSEPAETRESSTRDGVMRARRLQSSLIDRIVFDDEAETLTISFRNARRYIYQGVPRAIYDALAQASSAGRYFNDCIKGRFACRPDPARRRYGVG
jgi:hypothetical protein